jgi:choline kinase
MILERCTQWLETERAKRRTKRERRRAKKAGSSGHGHAEEEEEDGSADERLDQLEALLRQRLPAPPLGRDHSRRGSRRSLMNLNPTAASDTEYASDGDALVPGCEEWLKIPEEIGMDEFKREVLKLTHTLRCKGWRRVDLERYKEVGIERISGALTNAVSSPKRDGGIHVC